MKNKKKVVLFSLLAVFVIASLGVVTYARYQSKGTGEDTVKIAKWAVKVNDQDITGAGETEFDASITWTGGTNNVVNGFIAPGMTGTANVAINPAGSQVAINYWIQVNSTLPNNDNIKINGVTVGGNPLELVVAGACSIPEHLDQAACEAAEGGTWTPTLDPHVGMYKGTINLPEGATMTADQTVTATVSLEWTDVNSETANAADTATGVAATELGETVTINVIVEQKVN